MINKIRNSVRNDLICNFSTETTNKISLGEEKSIIDMHCCYMIKKNRERKEKRT